MGLKFTETQKKISQSLLSSPATIELLVERTGVSRTELQPELQLFQQLKLVSFDEATKNYMLKPEIAQELKRRKSMESEDDNAFRLSIIIEAQAIEENLLKKQLEKVIESLQKEPYFLIYAHSSAPIQKVEEKYSSFIDVNLSVRDFRALVRLMFFYGPTSVEVIKPKEIKFTMDDFQNGLVDMGEMVHGYAEYIMGLLSRQQVEDFNRRLFNSLQTGKTIEKAIPSTATPHPTLSSPKPAQKP